MKIYLPISFGIDALLLFLLKDFITLSVFSIAPLFILALSVFIAVLYKRTKNESLDFHVNSFGMTQKEKEECNIFVSNFLLLTLPFHVLLIFLGNAFLKNKDVNSLLNGVFNTPFEGYFLKSGSIFYPAYF